MDSKNVFFVLVLTLLGPELEMYPPIALWVFWQNDLTWHGMVWLK